VCPQLNLAFSLEEAPTFGRGSSLTTPIGMNIMANHGDQEADQPEVMVVDDNPTSLNILTEILGFDGYRVRPSSSGLLALKSVTERMPDMILLDVRMPDIDGYEVCRRLKSDERSRNIPVIFISALGETTEKVEGFRVGGVDYITKPFGVEEVLARVKTHLTLRNMRKELEAQNEQLQQEVTERKQAEGALRESEAKYRVLIDNLPSIVYRGYADWSVDFMDRKVELIIGYPADEFNSRQRKWSDIMIEEDIESAGIIFKEALKTNKSYVREYRIRNKAGEILWIQERGHIVCDTEGKIEYVSGVCFDITERKHLEKAVMQREKLNTLGAIAAEVAHEIRNPLVSLGGFARRLLKKFPDVPECSIILHECKRLEEILSRIRNYLRPVEAHYRECLVNDVINDCVALLSPEMAQRKITCRLDLDPKLPVVYADPQILTQTIINLLLNGVEAMDKGGILDIKSSESDHDLHIEFRNPAQTSAVKNPDLLFMPFAEGGESIGLPLCYRMLRNMGGLLLFSSEKDYMVFRVSLPKTVKPPHLL
jgi:PAS domain S-box-containing protein